MAKPINQKPELLLAQMQQMRVGLTSYSESFTPASPTAEELDAAISDLTTKLQSQVEAAGAAETATQVMYAAREDAMAISRRLRDQIYAHFGKHDARIVEFGLDTLPANRSNQNADGPGHRNKNGSEETE